MYGSMPYMMPGMAIPSSNAVDAVINLNVEPGSYVSEIALYLHTACNLLFFSASSKFSQLSISSWIVGSNGSFKLVKWDMKDQLVFEKNENYWDKDSVKLDTLSFKLVSDETTAYSEL